MTTEWLKVMLEEIARKRDEAARAHEELVRRGAGAPPATSPHDAPRPRPTAA